ncbi:MAG TPA: hypothetical protein ENN23_01105 [Deltaproteobacteria bacterium]|nr:hypothetical protein [Deltaproteobacteria bacterium]
MLNWISRKRAKKTIRKRLIKTLPWGIELHEGIPPGCVFYGVSPDEPCWTAYIPPCGCQIGSDHYICVSKKSGRIIYDGKA